MVCFTFILLVLSPLKAEDKKEGETETVFFANVELLEPIFERLYQLENSRAWKVNIVHVGDSHIQADFLTDAVRKALQSQFGDGGYGFTFPYSLMRTNGTDYVKYTSNASWKSRINVSPVSRAVDIGLSGIGLYTEDRNYTVQLNVNNDYTFNSVKVLYSTEDPQYQISLTKSPVSSFVKEDRADREKLVHRIKRGESLSIIAARYKTTVVALKQENNLRSDNIQAGRTLNIPSSAGVQPTQKTFVRGSLDYVDLQSYPYYSSYISSEPLNRISVFSNEGAKIHDINGFVIENDKPGLVYHAIGVNGAKMSDFNKYPLFFKQLPILKPDLVVLSFGTNESYQKLSAEQYLMQVEEMIDKIKANNPNSVVLVMTPPPSLLRRRASNTLVGDYSSSLMKLTNVPIWNLYEQMGGEAGILSGGKYATVIARDKIHYTLTGYKIQGEKFAEDFLKAYKQYKLKKQN